MNFGSVLNAFAYVLSWFYVVCRPLHLPLGDTRAGRVVLLQAICLPHAAATKAAAAFSSGGITTHILAWSQPWELSILCSYFDKHLFAP